MSDHNGAPTGAAIVWIMAFVLLIFGCFLLITSKDLTAAIGIVSIFAGLALIISIVRQP